MKKTIAMLMLLCAAVFGQQGFFKSLGDLLSADGESYAAEYGCKWNYLFQQGLATGNVRDNAKVECKIPSHWMGKFHIHTLKMEIKL